MPILGFYFPNKRTKDFKSCKHICMFVISNVSTMSINSCIVQSYIASVFFNAKDSSRCRAMTESSAGIDLYAIWWVIYVAFIWALKYSHGYYLFSNIHSLVLKSLNILLIYNFWIQIAWFSETELKNLLLYLSQKICLSKRNC